MNGLTELFLYSSIRDYIYARIEFFTEHVLSQNLKLAIATILGLLTVWVMIQGYLMATGRSQEGIKGFVFNLGKNYLVILVALSFAAGGSFSVRAMTDKFTDNISEIMSGDAKAGSVCLTRTKGNVATGNTLSCKIDRNLTATQAIMGVMNSIDTADDPVLEENIANAKWFAGIGSAGPSVVAGSMLIIFRIAMALFIWSYIYPLPSFQKNRSVISEMVVLWIGDYIFWSIVGSNGRNLHGFSKQGGYKFIYHRYRVIYHNGRRCGGCDAGSNTATRFRTYSFYPIDNSPSYGRFVVQRYDGTFHAIFSI